MRSLARILAVPLSLLVIVAALPATGRAAEPYYHEVEAEQPAPSDQPAGEAVPPTPEPTEAPPAPPSETPPPPAQAEPQTAAPPGQWIYTQQYGWIWMPYDDAYTSVPSSEYGVPYAYVYYPVYGWTWIAAPWVWGWGPWPHFGVHGAIHFGWFSHGWWRHPWRFHLVAPAPFPRGTTVRPHGRVVSPTPFRGGTVAPRPGGTVAPRAGGVRGGTVAPAPRAPGRSGGMAPSGAGAPVRGGGPAGHAASAGRGVRR